MELQEVEAIRQFLTGLPVDALSNQEGQFVGILAWSRDTDGALRGGGRGRRRKPTAIPGYAIVTKSAPTHRPVVVEMAKFVSKPLQVVGLEPR